MRPLPRPTRSPSGAPATGFTLLGFSLAVAGLAVAMALGLPLARNWLLRSRAGRVAADLRAFSAAFQSYATDHGDWPPGDGVPGAIPPGMQTYLARTRWQQPTPIGGQYAWDANGRHQGSRYRAVIVIASTRGNPVSTDLVQLLQIDRAIDDGKLHSGSFLLGFRDYPLFVLEH